MTCTDTIRGLNDTFRETFIGGRVYLTRGVEALPTEEKARLIAAMMTFSDFHQGNDPWAEHDFGAVDQDGIRYFWKIDYYNPTGEAGSEDPANPAKTLRVLTLMRADEY